MKKNLGKMLVVGLMMLSTVGLVLISGSQGLQAAEEKVTLRWVCYIYGADVPLEIAKECIKEFEELYPHIKVEFEWVPGANYWEKLQTQFAGGLAPDLTICNLNWVIPGAARGMFLDVLPYFKRDEIRLDKYFPQNP